MGLGSNYVSNYIRKSEQMIEMIARMQKVGFSYVYNVFCINE